jgi:Sulfotransferase family
VAALSSDALVEGAAAATGLDDFGGGPWRDGLDVLCDSASREGDLNDVGVAAHGSGLGRLLEERLGVVDWYRRHPEIDAQRIERPVIVVGLPRTGTTALAHLLAADPDTRSLRTWEAVAPTPPPDAETSATDPRIAATQAGIDLSHQMIPDLARLYFSTATSPSEALDLMGMTFRAFQHSGQAHIPSFEDWLLGCDMAGGYEFERRVLKLLQWRCPPRRWAWKNPPDVFWLESVRTVFPDAVFIWTHRDPYAALLSVSSLVAVVRSMGTDSIDRKALARRQVELWAEGIDRGMAARNHLGEGAFLDVWMADLDADPLRCMAGIYDRLGWPLTESAEDAMRAWSAANRRHGRGGHAPDPDEFGLNPVEVRERFAGYIGRFEGGSHDDR